MFSSQKWQFTIPLFMMLLFTLALLRADLRWKECNLEESLGCFKYPLYLPYELSQQIDLHWIAMLPAASLQLIPESVSYEYDNPSPLQWPRILFTILSCGCVWYLIGLWLQKLRSGNTLFQRSPSARFAVVAFVGLFVPFACFNVYLGMRGGYEGPTMTDAGLVMPLILAIMALVDLKVLPAALRLKTVRAFLALVFALLYTWTDNSYQTQLKQYREEEAAKIKDESAESGFIVAPLHSVIKPETMEGLAIHAPALIFAELPSLLIGTSREAPIWRAFRTIVVWGYWLSLFSTFVPRQPGDNHPLGKFRPWLRGICVPICSLALIGWLTGNSAHGPNPSFGFMLGSLLPIYALRPADKTVLTNGDC